MIFYVLSRNTLKKVNPFHKECITIEDIKLPETILVIPKPIPNTSNGGISPILKWANAKIKEEIRIPETMPKSLDKTGNKIPRNIVSSNKGANNVVVKNRRKKDK